MASAVDRAFFYLTIINIVNAQYQYLLNLEIENLRNRGNFSVNAIVETKWISQPLDHFDPDNAGRWPMRYFERTDMLNPGGPVVMFIGGEDEANPVWLTTALAYEVARETGAALFMSEHRYYGKSQPNDTTIQFQYLSTRQALADLAHLLKDIIHRDAFKDSKVLVIGGSYAGNMAAWMRLLYPDVVNYALASSAPVLAKLNFFEYIENVADNYMRYGGLECYTAIQSMFSRYDTMFKSAKGIEQLKKEENICDSSDMTLELNQHYFFLNKISPFMSTSQYGSPDEVTSDCRRIIKGELTKTTYSPLNLINVFTETQSNSKAFDDGSGCNEVNYASDIQELKDSPFYPWYYQTCAEYSYAQTTDSEKQPFTNNFSLSDYMKLCTDGFERGFTSQSVAENVVATNRLYGGLSIVGKVSNVIFTNFDMDPWHRLGATPSLGHFEFIHNNVLLFATDGSHCQDLVTGRINESLSVTATRQLAKSIMILWLT